MIPRGIKPPRWFRALRSRAVMVVLVVLAAPLALVMAAGWGESSSKKKIERLVRSAKQEALQVLTATPAGALSDRLDTLDDIAARHDVWLRVLNAETQTVVDVDHEPIRRDPLRLDLFNVFTDQQFDARLGAMHERPELEEAKKTGHAFVCRSSVDARLISCVAVGVIRQGERLVGYVYVNGVSYRSVRALIDLKGPLLKVSVMILPGALLLAWWLGWRMVVPIERLRKHVLMRAESASPKADLPDDRNDELGDLAAAFNHLLTRLEDGRNQHFAFVQDLAHELKNPTAAIRASAEALADQPPTPERVARLTRVLEQSSRRLDVLLSDFLELARTESGMPGELRKPVDLAQMIRGILENVRNDVRYDRVSFSWQGPETCMAPGVSGRLEAAIRNLVDNGAAFALHADEPKLEVALVPDGQAVVIEVKDNGPGIAPEDLPRVFERFYSRKAEGTGLGLALVKAVAEAHDGRVDARSEPGVGTVFSLRLPR